MLAARWRENSGYKVEEEEEEGSWFTGTEVGTGDWRDHTSVIGSRHRSSEQIGATFEALNL
jgi:hypothetical protein